MKILNMRSSIDCGALKLTLVVIVANVIISYFSYLFYVMLTQLKFPSMVPRFPCSRSINVRST